MNTSTVNLITILRERVAALRAAGNPIEALHTANAAVDQAQRSLTTDSDSIDAFCQSLEIRAELLRELGEHGSALDDYRQALDQLDCRPDRLEQIGRLHAGLGASHDALGNTERAVHNWQAAINSFERANPPCLLDVASLSNNLGFLAKAEDNLDAAEAHFLRALDILHTQLGSNNEETASVSNNLGALYQAAGHHEQAREMHMMALDARRNLFGEEHPDTAQSHNNLALALLNTGDRPLARGHFEQALNSFEALGTPCCDDLKAVASNYCEFLREEEESELADAIDNRIEEHLARHWG